ncbi:MAG: cytochrome P450 [Geminicoccaceae bacterium]|nr:cytochrome P450 [Geminicoccaceae bacterium]
MPEAALQPRPALVPPRPRPAVALLPAPLLLPFLRRNVLQTWGEPAYRERVVQRPFLGRQSVLLNDLGGVRRVLVDNHQNYGRTATTDRLLRPMIGEGLFLAEGDAWKRQRRLAAPSFAPRAMDIVAAETMRGMDRLLDGFAGKPQVAINLLSLVQNLTLDIAGRVLFSQTMAGFGPGLRRLIESYGRAHARPTPLDFMLPHGWSSLKDRQRERFARTWRDYIDTIIEARAATPPANPPRDLFDTLALARDAEGGGLSREEMRDQIATFIIAGHETTALTLFWSLYLLALDKDAQARVAGEAALLDDASPEAVLVERLPFTKAVVQEALRLYPVAFTIVREAKGPDEVAGVAIEKGALVVAAPWILHRHKAYWEEPHAFRPERFLPGAPPPERFAYLPFGAGPRVCIGAQFALIEATLVLARLVRACDVGLVGRRVVMPVGVVTIYPDKAPPFRLTPRGG